MLNSAIAPIISSDDEKTTSGSQTGGVRTWPFLTVIVPVRNEAQHLAHTLSLLVDQDYPVDRYELLVIDGMSTDGTRVIAEECAKRDPRLRVFENPGKLSSCARNIGVRNARGDIVVVIDGHCEFDGKTYLQNVAHAFERSGADCLGRPQPLNVSGATGLQRAIAAARSSWLGHHPASFIYSDQEQIVPAKSVAVAYRREVFEQVGMFDESFDACEDVELNHRVDQAGLRCLFTPSIAASYVPRASLRGLFRQMARYGRGRVKLLRKHPETFSIGSFVPAVWLVGMVIGPLVGVAFVPLWWFYLGGIAIYLAAVAVASIQVTWKHREARFLLFAPLVFVTVHAGTGYGVLREAVRPLALRGGRIRSEGQPCTS